MSTKLPKFTAQKCPIERDWKIYKDGKPIPHLSAATHKEAAIHLKRVRKLAKIKAGLL